MHLWSRKSATRSQTLRQPALWRGGCHRCRPIGYNLPVLHSLLGHSCARRLRSGLPSCVPFLPPGCPPGCTLRLQSGPCRRRWGEEAGGENHHACPVRTAPYPPPSFPLLPSAPRRWNGGVSGLTPPPPLIPTPPPLTGLPPPPRRWSSWALRYRRAGSSSRLRGAPFRSRCSTRRACWRGRWVQGGRAGGTAVLTLRARENRRRASTPGANPCGWRRGA